MFDGSKPENQLDEQVFHLNFDTAEDTSSHPLGKSTTKNGSQLIAETLKELSIEEQGRVHKELHGLDVDYYTTKETPEFQNSKILEMENAIQRLKVASTWNLQLAGIEMAERQNVSYVKNRRLLLKFLRCDNWDPTKAASRLIRFFDWKLELFGEAKLTKDITMLDLPSQDIKSLKEGYLQRLPERDKAGRAIICSIYNGQIYDSPDSLARLLMYMTNSLDEESDKNGVVLVAFKIADIQFADSSGLSSFFVLRRADAVLPIHWRAMHKFLEVNSPGISQVYLFVDAAINAFSPETRVRVRLHYGSYTEWMYELMCFGIPHRLIPLTEDYKIKTKNHLEFLAMRKIAEQFDADKNNEYAKMTDLPSNNDVLLGKGKPIQEFCGNQRLCARIDDHLGQYNMKSKSEKTALAADIVKKVKMSNGQFLSKESGIWTEVSDDVARDKVSHMFRHQRQKGRATSKGPESQSCLREDRNSTAEDEKGYEKMLTKRIKV